MFNVAKIILLSRSIALRYYSETASNVGIRKKTHIQTEYVSVSFKFFFREISVLSQKKGMEDRGRGAENSFQLFTLYGSFS